jgi:hypothetical protein
MIEILTTIEKYFLCLMGIAIVILALMIWKQFKWNSKAMMGSFLIAGILGFMWKFILLLYTEEGIYAKIAELSEAGFMVFTTIAVFSWFFVVTGIIKESPTK